MPASYRPRPLAQACRLAMRSGMNTSKKPKAVPATYDEAFSAFCSRAAKARWRKTTKAGRSEAMRKVALARWNKGKGEK